MYWVEEIGGRRSLTLMLMASYGRLPNALYHSVTQTADTSYLRLDPLFYIIPSTATYKLKLDTLYDDDLISLPIPFSIALLHRRPSLS